MQIKSSFRSIKSSIDDFFYSIISIIKDIRLWFKYNFNRDMFNLLYYTAFKTYPFDSSYMYKIQYIQICRMLSYFKKSNITEDCPRIAKQLEISKHCLEYIIDELKDVELTWENNEPEFKYVGPKVNFRNIERFIDNETLTKYCEKHPETLYSEKCFKLYIKMLEQYSRNWCD